MVNSIRQYIVLLCCARESSFLGLEVIKQFPLDRRSSESGSLPEWVTSEHVLIHAQHMLRAFVQRALGIVRPAESVAEAHTSVKCFLIVSF